MAASDALVQEILHQQFREGEPYHNVRYNIVKEALPSGDSQDAYSAPSHQRDKHPATKHSAIKQSSGHSRRNLLVMKTRSACHQDQRLLEGQYSHVLVDVLLEQHSFVKRLNVFVVWRHTRG
jgi:hypothetical protein